MASSDLQSINTDSREEDKLLEECQQHENHSSTFFSTVRSDWDDKEAMFIGSKPEDKLSKTTKAKISIPDLSTMQMERGARVMAQTAVGRAFAVSKDDVGKNMVMNLLIKHFQKNANEEGSHLLKLRLLDVYSGVYGSMFGLVPWRINRRNGYIGPELLPISMRDTRPQPGRRTIDKSDYFGVRSELSIDWLKDQDPGVWKNVDNIITEFKSGKAAGDLSSKKASDKSYVERQRYPSSVDDQVFPTIEVFTEYRNDMWITWAPRVVDNKYSRPWILRVVKNPYVRGMLPIVVKHAFPLIDSLIGLGDFERGKTLQYAKNSLVNLYMDGVKYAIFPPLHINLDNVDPKSIRWGAGEKWYMQNPNADVQVMNLRTTEWLNTFQSTYGFLQGAIQNLSGSTQVSQAQGQEAQLGKTPEALKQYGMNQSARDEWDRFMMEDTLQQVYDRWTALTAAKLEVQIPLRIFGAEIKDIKKQFPDEKILEVFKSGSRGTLQADKSLLNDKDSEEPTTYDFEIETGSTVRKENVDEGEAASQMIKDFIDAPALIQEIRNKGFDISFPELYKRRMIGNGIKDWDKILIPPEENENLNQATSVDGKAMNPNGEQQQNGQITPEQLLAQAGQAVQVAQPQPGAAPVEQTAAPAPIPPQPASPQGGEYEDPVIAQVAQEVLGGINGIPVQR